MGHLYKITNIVNGKYYIGQTRGKYASNRWAQHRMKLRRGLHDNEHLQRAWNKYGEENFIFDIILSIDDLDKLNKLESKYIAENKMGYNILPGGDSRELPDSVKRSISNAHKGKKRGPQSAEHRRKIGEANSRRVWKLESREKIRKHFAAIRPEVSALHAFLLSGVFDGVVSPDGTIYDPIVNLRGFCREHDLSRACLRQVIDGTKTQHKGWTKYKKLQAND